MNLRMFFQLIFAVYSAESLYSVKVSLQLVTKKLAE
jgi:hypothetical protein